MREWPLCGNDHSLRSWEWPASPGGIPAVAICFPPASREGERPLTNFIHFNVAPTDSLDRTPEGKQKLIDARYEFYAADDFPNTRKLSYQQLLDLNVVYAGSPDKVAEQLIDLQDQFRFDEFLLIANYGGNKRWQAMRNQELFMTQVAGLATRGELRDDFETAVMQSIVGSGGAGTN